jgi:hypothetical protein
MKVSKSMGSGWGGGLKDRIGGADSMKAPGTRQSCHPSEEREGQPSAEPEARAASGDGWYSQTRQFRRIGENAPESTNFEALQCPEGSG